MEGKGKGEGVAFKVTSVARGALKTIVGQGRLPWPDVYESEFWRTAKYDGCHKLLRQTKGDHEISSSIAKRFVDETSRILSGVKDTVTSFIDQAGSHWEEMDGTVLVVREKIAPDSPITRDIDSLIDHHMALKGKAKETEQILEEQRKIIDELHDRLRSDSLTGIGNRTALEADLLQELTRAKRYRLPLSLAMVDLDDFKKVNDSYGHLVGDQVLKRLGQMMSKDVRNVDKVYRFGGEEFVIVMPHTPLDQGRLVAERVRRKAERKTFLMPDDGIRFKVTVSVGVSQLEPGDELEDLIARADQAMYQAKASGRNRVCVINGIPAGDSSGD